MITEMRSDPHAASDGGYVSRVPFDDQRIGAAAVYCADGRFGEQMDEFLHVGLGLPRYDRVAVPGGAGCLAGHTHAYYERTALDRQLSFLIRAHALRQVVLIAHDGCGFYKDVWRGSRSVEEIQAADLAKAARAIRLSNPNVEIQAFFARKVDGKVAFERWPVGNV
jgi:hypothetical protein